MLRKLALSLIFASSSSFAQVYVSGNVGSVNYKPAKEAITDSNDASFGVGIGYQVAPYFSVQLGAQSGGSFLHQGYVTKVRSEHLSGFFAIPIYDKYFGLVGAGVLLAHTSNLKGHNTSLQPAFGIGVGKVLTDKIDASIIASNVGGGFLGLNPKIDTNTISTSLRYKF